MIGLILLFLPLLAAAQDQVYSHQDSLFGSITPEREWWDLNYYHLDIEVEPKEKTIYGQNTIQYTVLRPGSTMQIELQDPLEILSIHQDGQLLTYRRDGFSYLIELSKKQVVGHVNEIVVKYGGHPKPSPNPPWSGGITWDKDDNGIDFVASSCQKDGPSLWWPCKDHPYDETDSMLISVTVPDHLMDVSNGRLRSITSPKKGYKTYHWFVASPINNYGVNINIGDYVHFKETYDGEAGVLDCDYYVLRDNLKKAKKQFEEVPRMLDAFEYWFGPYPFYVDGFKLVEAPYLGMEHQSSVTYGNGYKNGYLGRDLSGSGWGMKFDYIIIHESGHEWFANNITYADIADMWIHESFTTYSESLFLDYHFGLEASSAYVRGLRSSIVNDGPIIGQYDVHQPGSRDMYFKGANILHTLRQVVNDDDLWRQVLRGLNVEFYHATIRSHQLIDYIDSMVTEIDLQPFFTQYFKDARVPIFTYRIQNNQIMYKYDNVVAGFRMPIKILQNGQVFSLDNASDQWQMASIGEGAIVVDPNYYVATFDLLGQ
ncbi:M1 family metallopeptidase [Membranihabitans marinus]